MASRGELFDRLKYLSPAQFEEVLFRLEIEPWIIPGAFAEQSVRAKAVIQRLEQEQEGLVRLERTLAEPAISIIGEQYIGYEIEAQVKRIISEYTQQLFEGREEEKRQLDEFVMNNSSGVLLVTAAAGFGKSALLSHWQQTRQEDCFIAYHCFSYRYEKTRSLSEAYRHLLKQLYLYYNIRNGQFPNDENRMRDILKGMLGEPVSQEGKRLVIVLDGLDEAEKTFEPFFTSLPDGVFVIASARAKEGEEPPYLRNWTDNAQILHLKWLPREAIPKWLAQISQLATYAQDDDFVKKLDETTGGFPLYLRYLIDELRQVATQSQDVREVLAQTPKDFEKYVEQQLERLDELDLPEQSWQFFALLAVAKGVLEKEDIKTLTQMRDRDLRQLRQSWQVTRWMQITEDKFYAFAHPLLAKTFGDKLGDDAEDALQDLINYCARWQEHYSAYALRYYSEHLRDVKRWEELYAIARNEDFASAQRQQLPDQPDLPLKTVQLALQGAAERDDAGGMAEFLLIHEPRLMQIAQESLLDMLQLGSITGALALAEKFYPERCILWYLLLAWQLAKDATQNRGNMEQARQILERLQQKDLPRLSTSWMNDCAVYLLTHLLPATKGTFTKLLKRILDNQSLANLCQNFVEGRDFAIAIETARLIDSSYNRANALIEIAKAQPTAENFAAAIETARLIDSSYNRANPLIEIAKAQPTAENFAAAIETARLIDDSYSRANPLIEIAKAQPTAENFAAAIETARLIDSSYFRADALIEIAKAQPTAENCAIAIETARLIDNSDYWENALFEIAKAQAQAENFAAAIETAGLIDSSYFRANALIEIAKAQPTAENFAIAIETARLIDDSFDRRACALIEIAKAQPTAENCAAAIETARQIDSSYNRADALIEIAKAQPTAENFAAAIETARQIDSSYSRADALIEIAKAQPTAENCAIAIETARQIDSSHNRADALIEIAKAQPTAENFAAAIETAWQFDDSFYRKNALIEIAKAQPTAENFAAAMEAAGLSGDYSYDWACALIEIAKAQPTAENCAAAIETARLIDDSYNRAYALIEIAKAQPTAENCAAAIETARQIDSSYSRADALIEIAKAQPTAENFAIAIETARLIDDSYSRADALIEIAKAQPTAENFAIAIETARLIDDSYSRADALIEIAKAQPTAENFAAAIETARLIDDSYNRRADALIGIAKAQPTAENFAAAIETARLIDDSYSRADALIEIAKAQPTAENFAAAIETAGQIDNSYNRANALIKIAKAQVEAKLSKQALLTAEKIIINRHEHLPNIAAAFVETGDKENFKQLLIPCAYYLDAAYQMCGHLAKLYPAQATAVAEVMSTTADCLFMKYSNRR